jgi:hypothetical protein
MKLPPALERIIDTGGLIVALVVDIVMNVICFYTLAPDALTAVAFVSIGVMIVLFVFRSWSKNQIPAWIVFVAVVFFFDFSFTLEATRAQANEATSETAVYDDIEVSRLDSEMKKIDASIEGLRQEYSKAMKRETLSEINEAIKAEQTKRDQYEIDRKARINKIASKSKITSTSIFNAIPNAARDGRIIPLIVFGLIFAGLQFIISSSVDRKGKKEVIIKPDPVIIPATPAPVAPEPASVEPAPVPHAPAPVIVPEPIPVIQPEPQKLTVSSDLIEIFVKLSWYRLRMRTADFITPEDVFFDFIDRQKRVFPKDIYKLLVQKCIDLKITDIRGCILVKDEAQAMEMLHASN